MLSCLPTALIALVLASPVFSAPSSPNDLFRAISAHVKRDPDPPVCCLIPLPSVEPVEDDVLLSFEEWKEKQVNMQASARAKAKAKEKELSASSGGTTTTGDGRETIVVTLENNSAPSGDIPEKLPSDTSENTALERLFPHFQIPLTDRFNYASMDCSARVHLSHRSAKSPSSVLSSKRDRYMLSPCNTPKEEQFIVVELCEDIRIDTVQLANFEFFSGVFKDFTVSVAKTYTTNQDGWVVAGTYRANNVRGIQSFHPPPSLRDFYRFIRIDFLSHYGHEFYCPVSLLRVYGLTHLEEWKWETWEAESRAKREELGETSQLEIASEEPLQTQKPASSAPADSTIPISRDEHSNAPSTTRPSASVNESAVSSQSSPLAASATSTSQSTLLTFGPFPREHYHPITTNAQEGTHTSTKSNEINDAINDITTVHMAPSATSSTSKEGSSPSDPSPAVSETGSFKPHASSSSIHAPAPTHIVIDTTITASSASSLSSSQIIQSPPTGGESIYRTIMNRLTALEGNHTLYARYVEEQAAGVRDMLRRLGEDVGRLEGISKAQGRALQRNLQEWEKQRNRFESEYRDLMSRVDYLSDEIVLEKRLGVAQLCLLLTVIVFMGLTRGSRGEVLDHAPMKFNRSMREWSRRHLSFSGDWVNRFTSNSKSRSRSRERGGESPREVDHANGPSSGQTKTPFPSTKQPSKSVQHPKNYILMTDKRPKPLLLQTRPRSRTPSLRPGAANSARMAPRPTTPTTIASAASTTASRPRLKRANSHGGGSYLLETSSSWHGIGPVPKSAKRWARTAHLHEVKVAYAASDDNGPQEPGDVEGEKENKMVAGTTLSKTNTNTPQRLTVDLDEDEDIFYQQTPSRRGRNRYPNLFISTRSVGDSFDEKKWKNVEGTPEGSNSPLRPESPRSDSENVIVVGGGGGEDDGDGDIWVDTDTSADVDAGGFGFD